MAARSNPWPFSRQKTAKAKPVRRSSMTVPQATVAAFKAGQESGDTAAFGPWIHKMALADRGGMLKEKLRERFTQGVDDGEGGPYKDGIIKVHGYHDVRVTGKEATSHKFSSVDAAKHFLDFATAKNPQNPNVPDQLVRQAETSRNILELARLHKYARLKRNKPLLSAVEARAKQLGISHSDLIKNEPGKAWNPRKSKRNPQSEADALYESFHGRPPTETIEITEEVHEHEHLATLGKLVEIFVETVSGLLAHLQFDPSDPPWLASSEDGRQLYIEGGDQELDLKSLKMEGDEWRKDRMVIGTFAAPEPRDKGKGRRKHNLTYHTEKRFDAYEPTDYQHDLGEETGVRPLLEFEPRNNRLFITGGQYRIEQPLFDMSPGIEN
jgi:hypothetical protein